MLAISSCRASWYSIELSLPNSAVKYCGSDPNCFFTASIESASVKVSMSPTLAPVHKILHTSKQNKSVGAAHHKKCVMKDTNTSELTCMVSSTDDRGRCRGK